MCFICDDWDNNQISSEKAFKLIGESLKVVEDEKDRDHLMDLCDKIVDSLDKYKEIHS